MTVAAKNISLLEGQYPNLDAHVIKKASLILKAINHDLRKKIINLINEKKKITVTELFIELRLEQSIASQHLAILRRAKIVITSRDGKYIYYSVNQDRLIEVDQFINSLVK